MLGLHAYFLPISNRWTVTFGGPDGSMVALCDQVLFESLEDLIAAARHHDLFLDPKTLDIRVIRPAIN